MPPVLLPAHLSCFPSCKLSLAGSILQPPQLARSAVQAAVCEATGATCTTPKIEGTLGYCTSTQPLAPHVVPSASKSTSGLLRPLEAAK